MVRPSRPGWLTVLPLAALLLFPASVNAAAADDLDTALIEAAWDNDVERAAELIAKGADVNHKDETEQSAYLIATSEGYDELLDLTLANGADVASLDSFRGTGLIRAAERGHASTVGRLIAAGIDMDHINRLGWTALHEAIILGDGSARYVDTVRALVAAGADVELATGGGEMPLQLAKSRGQEQVTTTIERILGDEPSSDPDEALLRAATMGDADAVALALRAGANLETRDDRGRSPLLLAALADHLDVARLLVVLGANPDAVDDRSDTPWLVSGVTGSVPLGQILLAADPDLTLLNRFGGTALIPAADRGHVDYVRWAVDTDIDIDHVNDLGWTALLEAVLLGDGSERYQEIVRILVDAGADSTIGDSDGVLPLAHAEAAGYEEIAGILADR